MRLLYLCLGYCLSPIAFFREVWRAARQPEYRSGLFGRLGFGEALVPGSLWVHAVSVGEVQAAGVLLRRLRSEFPDRRLLLTTSTATGRRQASTQHGHLAQVRYLPYDLPGCVNRFLDRARPAAGVILETELWPTLYRACGRRGIPLLVASARLSERSVSRYRRFAGFVSSVVGAAHVWIAAQSTEDVARFVQIGADPDRTSVCGNIKYDQVAPSNALNTREERRDALGRHRPVWVAGSTHEGEERAALAAHRRIRETYPDALLVLAPRHPPRFESVADLLKGTGWSFQRWTAGPHVPAEVGVLLLDTIGELVSYYAAASAAFVGGSLVPIGGHNLLEPFLVGCPVVTGPSHSNDKATARLLTAAGAVQTVTDADALAQAVLGLWADPAASERAVSAAAAVLVANRGAVDQVCSTLHAVMSHSA
jgi:3-deoxy-D-manno-octulosonic-acid transferase